MSEDGTYNGWKNYETWAVGMYLDGNYDGEGTYREALEITRNAAENIDQDQVDNGFWTASQAKLYNVEDALKVWARELIEGEIEGIAADLLRGALDEVDWRELAEHKLNEVAENVA